MSPYICSLSHSWTFGLYKASTSFRLAGMSIASGLIISATGNPSLNDNETSRNASKKSSISPTAIVSTTS